MTGSVRRKLSDLSELITKGTTPTTLGYGFTDSGIPFLRVQNIADGRLVADRDTLFIAEETHNALARSKIRGGDVLVSIAGTIGRAAVVPIDASPMNCNQAVAIVRPTGDVHRPFLRHWLESSAAQAQMRNAAVTGTISNLSLSQLGDLKIALPSFPEQRRIAEILDKADALSAKRRAAIAQLDMLTQAIFLDMFGNPATNPNGWPCVELRNLGNVKTGTTPPSSEPGMFDGPIPFITPGDLESDEPNERSVTEAGARESRTVDAGATFVCCIGATIGKIGKARTRSAFNQQINAVEWAERVHPEYGYRVLRFFKPTIIAWGSSTTLPILKKSTFERLEIPVPPLSTQREFARRLGKLEQLSEVNRASLKSSAELFDSLQSRAFLGDLSYAR